MLRIPGTPLRLCDRIVRRDFLRIGSLAALVAPAARPAVAASRSANSSFGRAKRCLLLFLTGGPPQHDTWDPKPDAPAQLELHNLEGRPFKACEGTPIAALLG